MDILNHGEIVGTHHLPDGVIDHGGQHFSDLNHDLNSTYASDVESMSQEIDLHSQHLSNSFSHEFNPNEIVHSDCLAFSGTDFNSGLDHLHNSMQIETPSFDHLSASNFHAEVMPREATPDYAAAANNEGWAKHYEDRAASWASEGSYDMAASLQKEAEYYHHKADENLNK
jgi:hypothetical protein